MEGRGKEWMEGLMKGETRREERRERENRRKEGRDGEQREKEKSLYSTLMKNIYFV